MGRAKKREEPELKVVAEKKIEMLSETASEVVNRQNQLTAPQDELFSEKTNGDEGEDEEGQKKQGRRKNRKMNYSLKEGSLKWEEAEEYIKKDPKCGLVKVRECRHIALPFHQMTNIADATKYVSYSKIGKYRRQVKGVVLCVGDISDVQAIRMVDDHNVFHFDVLINMIVFRPSAHMLYDAVVTMVTNKIMTASIFGSVSVLCPVNDKTDEVLRGVTLNAGDSIMVKYKGSTVNRGICVLKGKLVRLIKKAPVEIKEDGEETLQCDQSSEKKRKIKEEPQDDDVKVKVELDESTPMSKRKKVNKKINFEEDSD